MKKTLFFLCIIFAAELSAAVVERPSQKYPLISYQSYSWMTAYSKSKLDVYLSDDAKEIITEDSLRRYFKLKMRNFVKGIDLLEDPKVDAYDYNFMYLSLHLEKYNSTSGIYFGLISLSQDSSVSFEGSGGRIYLLVIPVAGSKAQIYDFIKREVDGLVETYAQDYYYIEDLRHKEGFQ